MSTHSSNRLPSVAQARKRTRFMIQVTMLCAIQFVMQMVPFLGFIPLGPINATTMHLPVVLAGSLLGPKAGAIVGLCFGVISMIRATLNPTPLAFWFSPFVPGGNFFSLIIAIVPRVFLGIFAALVYRALKDKKIRFAAGSVAGLVATLLHTFMVLGGVFIFFGDASIATLDLPAIVPFLMGIVATNGIAEALIAMVVNGILIRILMPIVHKEV